MKVLVLTRILTVILTSISIQIFHTMTKNIKLASLIHLDVNDYFWPSKMLQIISDILHRELNITWINCTNRLQAKFFNQFKNVRASRKNKNSGGFILVPGVKRELHKLLPSIWCFFPGGIAGYIVHTCMLCTCCV